MKLFALIIAAFLSSPSVAAEVAIEMLNKDSNGNRMVYSQEIAKVDVGDTVTWLPVSKGHNVEMISSPNKMKFKSKNSKEVKITFDTPGIYYYWCSPHKGMGMIGLVVVGNDLSNIDDIASAKAIGKSKKKLKALLASLNQFSLNRPLFTAPKRGLVSMGSLLTTLVTRPSHLSHKDFDKWNETEELAETILKR